MGSDVGIFIAFFAGLLSFLSPCVLPLIPSYLSFISGVSFQELAAGHGDKRKIMIRTGFFVLGFSIVFVALGILFAGPALLFSTTITWLNLAAGLIVILLGLNIAFDFIHVLNREQRVRVQSRPTSALGATAVGMAFGAGWSPCIGPILASILFLAGADGEVLRAGSMLLAYSLGLGVPFLATGLAFTRVTGYLNRIKPYLGTIRVASGLFLVVVGLTIAFGRFQQINSVIVSSGFQLHQWSTTNAGAARMVFTSVFLLLGVFHPVLRLIRRRPVFRPLGSTLSLILISVGLLQWIGLINLGVLLGRWLMFQGI